MIYLRIFLAFSFVTASKLLLIKSEIGLSKTDTSNIASKFAKTRYKRNLEKLHSSENDLQRLPRAATAYKNRLWDYGVIPYEISNTFQGRLDLVKQAMRHWENHTCIKFVERNKAEHPNYVFITERACGCCSFFVGKKGYGPQEISIAERCRFGNILHELGHAIGFWHEHSRPDRDQYVNIVKENIIKGWEDNFNKLGKDEVDTLGLTYDYNSIMHYARSGFAKGKYLDTIRPIGVSDETQLEIGQRHKLSPGDIAQTNLLYRCAKCGATFQTSTGTFHSPSNSKELQCEWRITATHGEKILLTIDFDILETPNCEKDYVEIRDGYWHKSPLLAKLCGTKTNKLITSLGSRMLVTYFSKNPKHHRGFTALYQTICGGDILVDTEKHLESPNYPEDYHPNKECIWKITVPTDYKVALKFYFFELEHSDHCQYDRVEIRDGFTINSNLLGLFCGDDTPPDFISSSNQLFLKFISDGSVQEGGFSATVVKEYDECAMGHHGCNQECLNTLGSYKCDCKIGYELQADRKTCLRDCGGILETSTGTITTPSFPDLYPPNKTCVWKIIAPLNNRVVLNFTHFEVEGNEEGFYKVCEFDKLEIYGDTMEKRETFCGVTLPEIIMSYSNIMRLVFTSDGTMEYTGFSVNFFTDVDECYTENGGCEHKCINTVNSYKCSCSNGFILHENGHNCTKGSCVHEISAPFGGFGTPNYPQVYPNQLDCVWKFTTAPGHRVRVSFLVFEIEYHSECHFDRVEFFDGSSPEERSLGKFCGFDLPQSVTSSGSELYMTFKSDKSGHKKGFWATHSSICGGLLEVSLKEQHVFSHVKFGQSNYEDKSNCEWTIISIPGYSIKLTFEKFDLEFDNDCGFDYVEINDNTSSDKRFCGSTKPPDMFLEGTIVIHFRTDGSFTSKGFSLMYQAVNEKHF